MTERMRPGGCQGSVCNEQQALPILLTVLDETSDQREADELRCRVAEAVEALLRFISGARASSSAMPSRSRWEESDVRLGTWSSVSANATAEF